MKKYCFDLDGTLCTNTWGDYDKAVPYAECIDEVNRLFDKGNIIKIFTARGTTSKIDHTELTKMQLESWGCKYHELIMNIKPSADVIIDDIAINADLGLDIVPLLFQGGLLTRDAGKATAP